MVRQGSVNLEMFFHHFWHASKILVVFKIFMRKQAVIHYSHPSYRNIGVLVSSWPNLPFSTHISLVNRKSNRALPCELTDLSIKILCYLGLVAHYL